MFLSFFSAAMLCTIWLILLQSKCSNTAHIHTNYFFALHTAITYLWFCVCLFVCFFLSWQAALGNSTSSEAASVRLVEGTSPCSGIVQVFRSGIWGMVCYEGWDLLDANVLCRELGCEGTKVVNAVGYYGSISGQIWMSNVKCFGNESSLAECLADNWGQNSCQPDLYAGVICPRKYRKKKTRLWGIEFGAFNELYCCLTTIRSFSWWKFFREKKAQ